MKNFLRAADALPYRKRLCLSILCAVFAAILWGLNFTAVYPVLKLLTTGQSLQVWIDGSIRTQQNDIAQLQDESEPEPPWHSKPSGRRRRGATPTAAIHP